MINENSVLLFYIEVGNRRDFIDFIVKKTLCTAFVQKCIFEDVHKLEVVKGHNDAIWLFVHIVHLIVTSLIQHIDIFDLV